MPTLFLTKGLPASGKSTWAKALVEETGAKRINKDDLRAMVDLGKWSPENERLITKIRNQAILTCLLEGADVVVDETSISPSVEGEVRGLAHKAKAEFVLVTFDVPLGECLHRNSLREGTARVPDHVILSMDQKWNDTLKRDEVRVDRWSMDSQRIRSITPTADGRKVLIGRHGKPLEVSSISTAWLLLKQQEEADELARQRNLEVFESVFPPDGEGA